MGTKNADMLSRTVNSFKIEVIIKSVFVSQTFLVNNGKLWNFF